MHHSQLIFKTMKTSVSWLFFELLPGMKKDGGEESVELVRPFRMQEWYHSADIVQTLHLRA